MKLAAFLEKFIEEYLFEDLATMAAITKPRGNLNYPMAAACAAGIEVLGLLVSETPYVRHSVTCDGQRRLEHAPTNAPSACFRRYWKEFLYPGDRNRLAVGDAFYQLVRNGVAHSFAAKDLLLAKSGAHLARSVEGHVSVNLATLSEDLQSSYYERIKPIIRGEPRGDVSAESMRQRLDELLQDNERARKTQQAALERLPVIDPNDASEPSDQPNFGTLEFRGPVGGSTSGIYISAIAIRETKKVD